jgi:glutamate-1-semialdehyde 2,1-aminomutase
MISVHFDATPVIDFKSAANGDNDTFKKFFHGLQEGIYIAPSAYESWFITDALSYEDLDFTIRAVDKVSKTLDTEKLPVKRKFFYIRYLK